MLSRCHVKCKTFVFKLTTKYNFSESPQGFLFDGYFPLFSHKMKMKTGNEHDYETAAFVAVVAVSKSQGTNAQSFKGMINKNAE